MLHSEKTDLRREMRSYLESVADSVKEKSRRICDRLMTIDAFRQAQKSRRLMSFVSMPLEVDTMPVFADGFGIVPYCEANEIVPIRICSMDDLEPSDYMKIWEPKLHIRQDETRQVLPEQIDLVLVPGLAFDRFGNRLGRGGGYYDRFLRRLPVDVLTIGLAFDGMIREHIPLDAHDHPVKMVMTENKEWGHTKRTIF